jgi:hypothetical protein
MHREFQGTNTLADLGPVFAESPERAVDRARNRLGRPPGRCLIGDLQAILDPRHLPGEFLAALCRQAAAVEQPIEPACLIKLFQPDCPLDRFHGSADLALPQDPGGCGRSDDRHRIEVERRSEPPIEPYLLLAEVSPSLERTEVEEAEIDRLLHLVHIVAGEKHPRDVGLDELHVLDGVGIGRRREQAVQQGRFVGRLVGFGLFWGRRHTTHYRMAEPAGH